MKVIKAMGLLLLNLIFVVGPAAGILGIYVGLWAAAVGLVLGAAAGVASIFLLDPENVLQIVYLSMMAGGLGVLLGCTMVHAGRLLRSICSKYIGLNVRLVQGGQSV